MKRREKLLKEWGKQVEDGPQRKMEEDLNQRGKVDVKEKLLRELVGTDEKRSVW